MPKLAVRWDEPFEWQTNYRPIKPHNGVYTAPNFTVEVIHAGFILRCDEGEFKCTLELDGSGNPEVDSFQRTIWRHYAKDLHVAISVFEEHVGLQKIVLSDRAPTEFIMKIEGGRPPSWFLNDDPEALDNFYNNDIGRIIKADNQRKVKCSAEVWEENGFTYVKHSIEPKTYRLDPATHVSQLVDEIAYPVRLHANYTYQLVQPADEPRNGNAYNNTTWGDGQAFANITVGYTPSNTRRWAIGLVFPLGIPNSASITSADLNMWTSSSAGFGQPDYTIYGDADLTQANFSGSDLPEDITKTSNSVNITNTTGSGNTLVTFDVTDIIQELVDDGAYAEDDVIRLILESNTVAGYHSRVFYSASRYNPTIPTMFPEIDIEYESTPDVLIVPPLPMNIVRHSGKFKTH